MHLRPKQIESEKGEDKPAIWNAFIMSCICQKVGSEAYGLFISLFKYYL